MQTLQRDEAQRVRDDVIADSQLTSDSAVLVDEHWVNSRNQPETALAGLRLNRVDQ
jgi:hypothetical protein